MIYVLIRQEVQDYTRWRKAFDDALLMRRNAGEERYRLFRGISNVNEVTMLCDFDTLDHARKFLESDALKNAMKDAGTVGEPTVSYLQEALNIRRTAAD